MGGVCNMTVLVLSRLTQHRKYPHTTVALILTGTRERLYGHFTSTPQDAFCYNSDPDSVPNARANANYRFDGLRTVSGAGVAIKFS